MLERISKLTLIILCLAFALSGFAQSEDVPKTVEQTFYTTRIINSHSTETIDKKTLDFRINHRFGALSGGAYEFFGIDRAMMRMGFDYAISDDITLGIGRSTFEKTFDAFAKYRFLRQYEDKDDKHPISMVWVSGVSLNSLRWADRDRENYFSSRLSYSHQLLIARKFNKKVSLQLMPTLVHRNLIDSTQFSNDIFAVGGALRYKIMPSLALNVEYFHVIPGQIGEQFTHPLSVGFDISTGWHTFQLHFTNATGTFEEGFIAQTSNRWDKGQIHFGFNISRQFHLGGY